MKPAAQSVHVDAEIAPASLEYFPVAQSAHVEAEVAPLLLEYFPEAQFVQVEAPVTDMYVPGTHAGQDCVIALTHALLLPLELQSPFWEYENINA